MKYAGFSFELAPRLAWQRRFGPPAMLSVESVAEALPGAAVRAVAGSTITFEMLRGDHLAQINWALGILEPLGWELIAGEVSELVDDAVGAAAIGALGGALVGGGATDNPGVALITGLIGSGAGWYAGSQVRRRERLFLLRPTWPRGYELLEVPPEAAREVGLQAA